MTKYPYREWYKYGDGTEIDYARLPPFGWEDKRVVDVINTEAVRTGDDISIEVNIHSLMCDGISYGSSVLYEELTECIENNYFQHTPTLTYNIPKIFRGLSWGVCDFVSQQKIRAADRKGFSVSIKLDKGIIDDVEYISGIIRSVFERHAKGKIKCNVHLIGNCLELHFHRYTPTAYDCAMKVYKKMVVLKNTTECIVAMDVPSLKSHMKNENMKMGLSDHIVLFVMSQYNI